MGWTPAGLPPLDNRTYFITGGNSGLGFEATRILCAKGARVLIGCRSEARANDAIALVRGEQPTAKVEFVSLDLADLDSVDQAASEVISRCDTLDALVNNAGVMQTPQRETKQGFELQLGTNHLGHFRLGAALFPLIRESQGRVVPVASVAHKMGRIQFDDLMFERRTYEPTVAYCQSKLANILFGFELDRRLRTLKIPVKSIPCHPGYAATNLQSAGVGMEGGSWFLRTFYKASNALVAQKAEHGAWPLVLAAADPEAESGTYYGPTWLADSRGPVGPSGVAGRARKEETARRLWEVSEELVGPWPFDEAPA